VYILGRTAINRWNVFGYTPLLSQTTSYNVWILYWY